MQLNCVASCEIGLQMWCQTLLLAACLSLPACGEELRTWTDSTGTFQKTATFVRLDGDYVFLRLENNTERKIPIAKLSKADQEYARESAARHRSVDPFESVADPSPNDLRPAASGPSPDGLPAGAINLRVVTVEGVGVDATSAKKDAYREAVRQVVGAFVDSSSLASQDQLIEDKVIMLSSAFVEKAEPIKETQDGRLVRIRLRAHVRVNKLLDSLRSNKISTLRVDAESLIGQAETKADQTEGMEQLVAKLLPGFQKACLKATAQGKPEIKTASSDEAELVFWLRIEPRLDAYTAFATKLDAALSAAERPSGELVSPGTSLCDGSDYREHVRNFRSSYADYWLPRFFLSQADGELIKNSLNGSGESVIRYDPLYVVSEATASAHGSGIYILMDRVWGRLTQTKGEMIVMLLVHANESGARTRWKWFRLRPEEADILVANLDATTKATAVLRGKDGGEIARETVHLANVGVKVLNAKAIVISPFFMIGDYLSNYIPVIETKRSVRLTKSEVSLVDKIEAFVERGGPLSVYDR